MNTKQDNYKGNHMWAHTSKSAETYKQWENLKNSQRKKEYTVFSST